MKSLFLTVSIWLCLYAALVAQVQYKFTNLNANGGLSHNQVNCVIKDKTGFLWIGTVAGLNRFDGYETKVFRKQPHDSTSIHNNDITRLFVAPDGRLLILAGSVMGLYDPEREIFHGNAASIFNQYDIPQGSLFDIVEDKQHRHWFLHATEGIVITDSIRSVGTIKHIEEDETSISTNSITALVQESGNAYWVMNANGVLEKMEFERGRHRVLYRSDYLSMLSNKELLDYRMMIDTDNDLWIYSFNKNQGVFHFSSSTQTWQHFNADKGPARLNTNIIRGMVQDNHGMIWVATDHGGVNLIDKKDFSIRYIYHNEEDGKSLAQNSINTLYKDNEGIIWAGTFKKGVSYYHENILRFPLYKNFILDKKSLPYQDVNRFIEDEKGNLWIGTNGGGLLYYNRQTNTYTQYKHNPNDPTSISADVIVSLCIDQEKKLWVGTYYGGLNYFDGKKFIRYTHDSSNPLSLSEDNVWEIFEDSQRRLWVGTLGGGVDLFDRRSRSFWHFRPGDTNSVQSRYIAAIAEDASGNVWFGTDYGIDVLEKQTGRFIYYVHSDNDSTSLSNNSVIDINTDSDGRVWIGTHGGLNLFETKTKTFRTFTEAQGLPHNSVLTIVKGESNSLWLGTPNGLSHMTIRAGAENEIQAEFKNYNEVDGLPGKQFNENAAFRTSKGELVFGGANGFTIFKPEQLGVNTNVPKVVFSDFQLFNKSVRAGEEIDGEAILSQAITTVKSITLPANKNVFSIQFAALNFFQPEKSQYKYKLEGFNADWLPADSKSRRVTFTNLDPGTYTLRVIASNNDGVWNNAGASLQITVLPPFWKSKTAFVLYALAVIIGLTITRKLIQQREQMKFAIRQERQEALRMHELDMMKIKFFTNVSHEFRTPLTLILTPLEKLIKNAEGDQRTQFELIQRNARRLLNLVNQLLDFRKMEVQEIKFQPSEGDIIAFIHETVSSFSDLSDKKNIALNFESSVQILETIFDQDKLEKILFNLLSNAFKFTPEHGSVSVFVEVLKDERHSSLKIEVRDTGIGIATDKLDRVFDRFFQNELPKSMVNQGSGIGLSITREFVKIHGGTITVTSEVGRGSCFIVVLPLKEIAQQATVESKTQTEQELHTDELVTELMHSEKPVVLLVEDNEDFRFYLKDNLKTHYEIVEAANGQEGWKKIVSGFPDLVVSDVMMPEMNGLELCRRIKSDQRVSHIPIILLTARTSEEQRLEGFETGADDYINKPFNFEILESRIRNLILQRSKLHAQLAKQTVIKASELNITSLDEQFIQNAIRYVETNISNADFSVEDLSRELGISRAHFYKKVLALTGKSPLEFIRNIRLQQAAQLLEKSQLTVAEVAYKVGFNNPKYFAKYFKETYHILPSAYAMGKRR